MVLEERRLTVAGNSQRRGAKRAPGSKKGATAGTGGHNRRRLTGKGPTPKAEERKGHPAARRSSGTDRRKGAASSRQSSASARVSRPPANRKAKDGAELVAGRNAVVEALRARVPATVLYVMSRIDQDDRVREALKLAAETGIPMLEASRGELDRLAAGIPHQGLAVQIPPYAYVEPDQLTARAEDAGEEPLVVALDGVTDPRNLGAVIRSAAALGGHGVLIPERRSASVTAGAWKASAGAAARLPVARATNLTRALEQYKRAGLFVAGLDADGDIELSALEVAIDPLVLVVGSEGKGLSRLVRQTCDLVVRIPMAGGNESLNAGVATGIALYEIAHRRAG